MLSKDPLFKNIYFFNRYEFPKRWIHAFVGKFKDRCFCSFRPPYLCPSKEHQHDDLWIWVNIFPKILHMKYHTGLILAEAFCIFVFFYFPDSALSVLNGLQHWPTLANPFLCKIGMGRRHTPFRQPPFSSLAIRCDLWQAWFKIRNFLSGLTALSTKHFSSKSRKQRIRLSCSSSNFLTIIRRASILSVHDLPALKLICWSHILWSTASFNLKKYLRLSAFSGTESIEIPLYFFSTSR